MAPPSHSPLSFSTHLLYLFFTRYYLKIKKCVIKVREGKELKGRIKIFSKCIVLKVIFVSCVGGRNNIVKLGKQTYMLLTLKRQVWWEHGLYSYQEQVFQEINRNKLTRWFSTSSYWKYGNTFLFCKSLVFNWDVMYISWRLF